MQMEALPEPWTLTKMKLNTPGATTVVGQILKKLSTWTVTEMRIFTLLNIGQKATRHML
jgi:hypothetical protein